MSIKNLALVYVSLTLTLAMTTTPAQVQAVKAPPPALEPTQRSLEALYDQAPYVLHLRPFTGRLEALSPEVRPSVNQTGHVDLEQLATDITQQSRAFNNRALPGLYTTHYTVKLFEVVAKYKAPAGSANERGLLMPAGVSSLYPVQMPGLPAASKEIIALQIRADNAGSNEYSGLYQAAFLAFLRVAKLPPAQVDKRDDYVPVRNYLASASQPLPPRSQPMPKFVLSGDIMNLNSLPDPTKYGIQTLLGQTGGTAAGAASGAADGDQPRWLSATPQPLPPTWQGPTWLNANLLPRGFDGGVMTNPADCSKLTVYRYQSAADRLKAGSETASWGYRLLPDNKKSSTSNTGPSIASPLQPFALQTKVLPALMADNTPFLHPTIEYAHLQLPGCGWVQFSVTQKGSTTARPYWYNTQTYTELMP